MSAHILVVDDDEPSLEELLEMLALEHYVVSTATDGFEDWLRSRPKSQTSFCST